MNYKNISKHPNLPFEQYRALGTNRHSHSSLKSMRDGIATPFKPATAKMQIGTLVDEILTGKADISPPQYSIGKKIAHVLRSTWGDAFNSMEKQLSYTATIEHDGLELDVMGRPDFKLGESAILDLKVSQVKTRDEAIKIADHFGYDNAIWHYGQMAGCGEYYLLVYCAKSGRIEVIERKCNGAEYWWADKVLLYGK